MTSGVAGSVKHGTLSCYRRGCREPECVDAKRAYDREYFRQRRAGLRRPAGMNPNIVVPERSLGTHKRYDGRLYVTCWCEHEILCLDAQLVRDGYTESCGRDTCIPV